MFRGFRIGAILAWGSPGSTFMASFRADLSRFEQVYIPPTFPPPVLLPTGYQNLAPFKIILLGLSLMI